MSEKSPDKGPRVLGGDPELAEAVEALAASVKALWQAVTDLKKTVDRHIRQNVQVSTTIYPHYYETSTWDVDVDAVQRGKADGIPDGAI